MKGGGPRPSTGRGAAILLKKEESPPTRTPPTRNPKPQTRNDRVHAWRARVADDTRNRSGRTQDGTDRHWSLLTTSELTVQQPYISSERGVS